MHSRVASLAAVVAAALTLGAPPASTAADEEPPPGATQKAFYAEFDTYGHIPDDSPSCGLEGTPREVEFEVSGVAARRITGIYLRFAIFHPSIADVDAKLVAPDGTEHVLFADSGGSCGESGHPYLDGSYGFIDDADRSWWTAAAALDDGDRMDDDDTYRTVDETGAVTSMVEGFADVEDPNGTWVLRITDDWNGERGHVTGAELGMAVDTIPPDTQVSGPESGATVTDHPTYQLDSPDEDVVGFRCWVNGSEPFPCTSPWTPILRNSDQPHLVAIAAVDRSGNVDPSPETRTFVLQDRVPPETMITAGPPDAAVLTETPTWEFTSPAPDVQGFWCSLDLGPWTACTSPHTPTTPGSAVLAPGPHVWAVVAVDENSNTDPTPEIRQFVLRDVACEDAQATLEKAQRRLQRAEASGDRARIREAKRTVRRAERAVASECADVPARQGAR